MQQVREEATVSFPLDPSGERLGDLRAVAANTRIEKDIAFLLPQDALMVGASPEVTAAFRI